MLQRPRQGHQSMLLPCSPQAFRVGAAGCRRVESCGAAGCGDRGCEALAAGHEHAQHRHEPAACSSNQPHTPPSARPTQAAPHSPPSSAPRTAPSRPAPCCTASWAIRPCTALPGPTPGCPPHVTTPPTRPQMPRMLHRHSRWGGGRVGSGEGIFFLGWLGRLGAGPPNSSSCQQASASMCVAQGMGMLTAS